MSFPISFIPRKQNTACFLLVLKEGFLSGPAFGLVKILLKFCIKDTDQIEQELYHVVLSSFFFFSD